MQGLGKTLITVFLAYLIFLLLKFETENFNFLLMFSLYILGFLLGAQRVSWFRE